MLVIPFSRILNAELSELSITCEIASIRFHLFALGVVVGIAGCSGRPPALRPPDLDPESAAKVAIALYDKDGDGILSSTELEACPGMLESLTTYDRDSDEKISQEEIVQRLQRFVARGVSLSRVAASVRLDGGPLGGATIRFIPEQYLGDEIKRATGVTRRQGSATMAVAVEDLPENQKGIRGVHSGTYRVEITHPEISIPAKYNTETTLGYETKPGEPYVSFELKSR